MSPEAYNQEVLSALRGIQKDVAEIKARLGSGAASGQSSGGDGGVADAADLDGQHGDPSIKFNPPAKYWGGKDYVGYRFSETDAEYLDAQAKYLDACAYMAEKDSDEKKRRNAKYKRKDAARARGWAARLRSGWTPPQFANGGTATAHSPMTGETRTADQEATGAAELGDDDIPF